MKLTIIGLLLESNVFKTRTAFPVESDVVVSGIVTVEAGVVGAGVVGAVVVGAGVVGAEVVGAGVVATQSNSLQGQPAEQFS